VKDLAPSSDSKGNYEGFETLVDRANVWLREQKNVSILNMQSVMVQEMRQGQSSSRLRQEAQRNRATLYGI